jgi:hypothetical protein
MNHEIIIKDSRGTLRIVCELITYQNIPATNGDWFKYYIRVWHKEPKKRNEYYNNSIATDSEIYACKMELWNKLKP